MTIRRSLGCAATVCALVVLPASPCGGPKAYRIDAPLARVSDYLWRVLAPDTESGLLREELLFLYPFHAAQEPRIRDLWSIAYGIDGNALASGDVETRVRYRRVGLETFNRRLEAGDFVGAEREARRIVDRVLDMPAVQADLHQEELRRAVEFIELRPRLDDLDPSLVSSFALRREVDLGADSASVLGDAAAVRRLDRAQAAEYARAYPTSPRIASLRFVALSEALRHEIPNGWKEDIQAQVTDSAWAALEGLHEAWLRDYPDHPLADLVALSRLRLYYWQDDARRAWRTVLGVYPRRLPRVLGEMRFLLKKGMAPEGVDVEALDPVLRAALTPWLPMDPSRWSEHWGFARDHASEPWSVNLQERLLGIAARRVSPRWPLPTGFPETPENPTELWGELRLMGLLGAERWSQARTQAASLRAGSVAAVESRLRLLDGEWIEAIGTEGLDEKARSYLIRVLVPASALDVLRTSSDSSVAAEATLTLAIRLAGEGRWRDAAAMLASSDPDRAARWRIAGELTEDTSTTAMLQRARFLRDQNGRMFFGNDTAWYRSVYWRLRGLEGAAYFDERLPWARDHERLAIRRHLLTSSEMLLALEAYAAYLSVADPRAPNARDVLREADETYNWLVNWDSSNATFWRDYLQEGEPARIIRAAGRRIRRP